MGRVTSNATMAAALAAILAVAGGIYVIGPWSGNAGRESAGNCEGAVKRAARLNGVNTGAVAAFTPAQKPVNVSALAFDDANGGRKSIADWNGRFMLLNIWATWCAPCREEMPSLQALQQEKGGDAFEVVPVSIDLGTAEKPKKFYADNNLSGLGFFHDGTMGVFNALKKESLAFGMPATLLVDPQGCVLGALNGPADWASADAKALVGKAMDADLAE
jgi:thiol-disulfide isomerase/thioredoxin